jgi:hypothetical protein
MFNKSFITKLKMTEENSNGHFNPRYKAQSTSQLLSTDTVIIKSKSATPSPASSTSSLAIQNSSKNNFASFLKIPSPSRKSPSPQSTEDRFIMTIIKSPSTHSQRMASNSSNDLATPPPSSITATTTNEDVSNNGKFFKNKVTAAFNHMKYRKFRDFIFLFYCILFFLRLGSKNATKFSNK